MAFRSIFLSFILASEQKLGTKKWKRFPRWSRRLDYLVCWCFGQQWFCCFPVRLLELDWTFSAALGLLGPLRSERHHAERHHSEIEKWRRIVCFLRTVNTLSMSHWDQVLRTRWLMMAEFIALLSDYDLRPLSDLLRSSNWSFRALA